MILNSKYQTNGGPELPDLPIQSNDLGTNAYVFGAESKI
jgi:hypothetical protein